MSQLDRMVNRAIPAEPWAEGDNIPWDDPEFSTAMLEEHRSEPLTIPLSSIGTAAPPSQVALRFATVEPRHRR